MLATKFWRDNFLQLFLQLVLEYVLFVSIMMIAGQTPAFSAAIFGVAGLYAFRCANGLLKLIVSTPIYYVSKRRMISQVVAQFYHHKLPVRSDLAFLGGSEYIQEIANSKDASEELRHFIDRTLGELNGLRIMGTIAFVRMNAILDAAIERYVSENNAHGKYVEAA
jgi:hypothetical protein